MSEPEPPEIFHPAAVGGGVFANHVDVYVDVEYVTMDFIRLEPSDPSVGVLVSRVTAPTSCILILKERLQEVT